MIAAVWLIAIGCLTLPDAVATVAAAAPNALRQAADSDLSTDQMRRDAVRYAEEYRRALRFLLADEHYAQTRDADGRGPAPAESRVMRGELFLTFLERERRWMAVHDVADVDGVPVPDRDTLTTLLTSGSTAVVAARVAARNARYNLGTVIRNFNEPTLALLILDPDRVRGVRFARVRVTRTDGATVVTLRFAERERPTLVQSMRGGPVYAEGEIDVAAPSGEVVRTVIGFQDGPVRARLETRYEWDATMGLRVPVSFTERYDRGAETIAGEARYSNYRRFEASGRLVGSGLDVTQPPRE
jgi:hypothetical protein